MYRDQSGEFICGYCSLEGWMLSHPFCLWNWCWLITRNFLNLGVTTFHGQPNWIFDKHSLLYMTLSYAFWLCIHSKTIQNRDLWIKTKGFETLWEWRSFVLSGGSKIKVLKMLHLSCTSAQQQCGKLKQHIRDYT